MKTGSRNDHVFEYIAYTIISERRTMYSYNLVINRAASDKKMFFQYGNTKDISLQVGQQCAEMEKQLKKDYRLDLVQNKCYLINLLKEGMKRVALVHILKNHEPLRISKVELRVSDDEGKVEVIDLTEGLHLYSMITEELKRPIDLLWKNPQLLQNILKFQKSKENLSREISSLYAYLYSKTKIYETERFFYLWMAMNGMYAALNPMVHANDRDQMINLLKRFNLGTNMHTRESRNKAGNLTMVKLKDIGEPVTRYSLINGEHKETAERIEELLTDVNGNHIDISPYGYFLTDFAYYLRCRIFHSNTPTQLFSFYDDMELKAIRITNGLLEGFLDQNLPYVFKTEQS